METGASSSGAGGGSVGASDRCFFADATLARPAAGGVVVATPRRLPPGLVYRSSSNFGFLAMDLAK